VKNLLGKTNYALLDPDNDGEIRSHTVEGKAMRELMKTFNRRKKNFSGKGDAIIGLPYPLDTLTSGTEVKAGALTVKDSIMREFFDPCVNKIVEMINGQIDRVEKDLETDVKDVFLVGGFGESPYLKDEIRFSMERVRSITVRVPDTSWTAIVRGAVVVGIEKDPNMNFTTVKPCQKSCGLFLAKAYSLVDDTRKDLLFDPVSGLPMVVSQMQWLIRKGDAILSNQARVEEQKFAIRFTENGDKSGKLPIYTYPQEQIPARIRSNDPELVTHILNYNLEDAPLQEFECYQESKGIPAYYYATLKVQLRLVKHPVYEDKGLLRMALYWKAKELDAKEIDF